MIKGIVFDLDDTLISEKEYIKSGFEVISKKIGKDYNLDYEIINDMINELFEKSSKEVFNRLLDKLNIEYTKDYIDTLIKEYREHIPNIQFYNDVIPTLTELKESGYKLGIITDGYKETQQKKIEALNCRDLLDAIIITDELGKEYWKPHEKAYVLMAELLNIKLSEMIYVGDNISKDFVTANKLGIMTVYIKREDGVYNSTDYDKGYLASKEITTLKELKDIV